MKKFLLLLGFLAAFPMTAFAEDASKTIVDFNGEFVDQNAAALSGVLPLEFRIYSDSKAKKPLVTEKLFVAVVDGAYSVTLGEVSELRTKADTLSVGVYLDGKEVTRQDVSTQRQLVAENPRIVKTTAAGSENGDFFKLECPTGYVVTGIEGSAKNGIQGLKLICSQAIQMQ